MLAGRLTLTLPKGVGGGWQKNFFKHWLPTLSKPYYLIIFVDLFLHYVKRVHKPDPKIMFIPC